MIKECLVLINSLLWWFRLFLWSGIFLCPCCVTSFCINFIMHWKISLVFSNIYFKACFHNICISCETVKRGSCEWSHLRLISLCSLFTWSVGVLRNVLELYPLLNDIKLHVLRRTRWVLQWIIAGIYFENITMWRMMIFALGLVCMHCNSA